MLSRSDDPGWGVAALCCHRPPGTTRLSRSWRCSLTPIREVLARPSARLSQRACCLKKLFTCQGTPCRRGQTVTGSGTGRGFWFGKSFTLQRTFSRLLSTLFTLFFQPPLLFNGHLLLETQVSIEKKFCPPYNNGHLFSACPGDFKKISHFTTDSFPQKLGSVRRIF